MDISAMGNSAFSNSCCGSIDAEERAIMRRLLAYGVIPIGKKSVDREKLHSIEIKEAQQLNVISNKFLTLTKYEQEKIQNKKKEKRIENNPKQYSNTAKGAKILGEQLFLAIQIKKKLEEKQKKKQ